jgi:hypothetical protein
MTRTSFEKYQELNRILTSEQIKKLVELARLLEHIRFILAVPLIINSAYRCHKLNEAVGSTSRSQHLLCEAADFTPKGRDIDECFPILWEDVKDHGTNVGQLIHESAERSYGVARWIHVSLGTPYRGKKHCGQILKMEKGKYTRLA